MHSLAVRRWLLALPLVLAAAAAEAVPRSATPPRPPYSAMGELIMNPAARPAWLHSLTDPAQNKLPPAVAGTRSFKSAQVGDVNLTPGAPSFQSETSVAVAGPYIVVGFNDAAGFSNPNGASVSGFAWSNDGGASFTYGGQLPVAGNGDAVWGDPDVKAVTDPDTGQLVFVYSSIYYTGNGDHSLCIHVSTDGGQTWQGPREVTSATSATDFADKEFIDVDPETGRVLVSWTSFGSSTEMRCTYSDDYGLTWSPAVTFSARWQDGQGSCPRFDPTSDRAYIVWRAYGSPEAISLVVSNDNGATWSSPVDIVTGIATPLTPFGSDRINGFPALAVGPVSGDLHVVYASGHDDPYGDVYAIHSTDHGATWSSPQRLSSDTGGNARGQFFPWVAVADNGLGERVDVSWLDQRAGTAGSDLTELVRVSSNDGGGTWSRPAALTRQPFHAEYGQDTGQPNLGDYVQCASQGDFLYVAFARSGEADYQTSAPDAYLAISDQTQPQAPLRLADVAVADSNCNTDGLIVAGETVSLTPTLASDALWWITDASATLSTTTPGVTILTGTTTFASVPALGTGAGTPLRIRLDDTYPCGQPITLTLTGTSGSGDWLRDFTLPTGTEDGSAVLLAEDFDGVPAGSLPAGWSWTQRKGTDNPWQTSTSYAVSGSQSLFCADVGDTNWSRVASPAINVPADAQELEVSFAVTYDCEDLGDGRHGYDGALLKINIDGVDYLAGSFATLFAGQYRTQLVRSSGAQANPLQDLSAWTGNTLPDFENIRIRYPGLAGHTVRIVFEMGSDISVGATGFFVDDVQVRTIPLGCGSCTAAPELLVTPAAIDLPQVPGNQTTCTPVAIHNTGDAVLTVQSVTGCDAAPFSLDLTGMATTVAPGDSTVFQVCVTPTVSGADSCQVTVQTDGGTQVVPVRYAIVTAVPGAGLPRVLTVAQPAPNPFNPQVTVSFGLPRAAAVAVDVYDLQGRHVRSLARDLPLAAGFHQVSWDGRTDAGAAAPSGTYLFRVRGGGQERTVRAALVR